MQLNVYKAVMQPVLQYGAFLYRSAAPTVFKLLKICHRKLTGVDFGTMWYDFMHWAVEEKKNLSINDLHHYKITKLTKQKSQKRSGCCYSPWLITEKETRALKQTIGYSRIFFFTILTWLIPETENKLSSYLNKVFVLDFYSKAF